MLGAALGCGLLTKAYFLTAIPVMLFLCAWALHTDWAGRRLILAGWASAGLLAVLISGWRRRFIHAVTGTFSGQIQTVSAKQVALVERLRAIFHADWPRAFDAILVSHVWFRASSFLRVRSWMCHFFGWLFRLSIAAAREPGKGESVHDHGRERAARLMRGTSRLSPGLAPLAVERLHR